MIASSRERLLERLRPDDVVLDIGGWADPFGRADMVLDLMPYETRGMYERMGWVEPRDEEERFSAETWVQRDICDKEPYPYEDKSIDFVICSQTLEDIRDPIWVCSEMNRIAKAGYIEVPSRLEEQSWGVAGEFAGWPHHRWLIEVDGSNIEFVLKLHSLHARADHHFPRGFADRLTAEERVEILWWEGGFGFSERVILEEEESDRYLGAFVSRELSARGAPEPAPESDGLASRLRGLYARGRSRIAGER